MKPYKRKEKPEKETIPKKKPKKERKWILERQWKSKKAWGDSPKSIFVDEDSEYTDVWLTEHWNYRFLTPKGAENHLKCELRSGLEFFRKRTTSKNWRVRNRDTGEIINFDNIGEYYDT